MMLARHTAMLRRPSGLEHADAPCAKDPPEFLGDAAIPRAFAGMPYASYVPQMKSRRRWLSLTQLAQSSVRVACCALLASPLACGARAQDGHEPSGAGPAAAPTSSSDVPEAGPARCAAGSEPALIASAVGTAYDLKIAGGEAFWSSDSTVSKVSVCGGPITVLATFVYNPFTFLAVVGDNVYFTSNGAGVSRVARTGGVATSVASGAVTNLAMQGALVAWSAGSVIERLTVNDGSIAAFPLRGASIRVGTRTLPSAIALDASAVYWTDVTSGALTRMPFDGSATSDLSDSAWGPQGLMVDGENAYWVISNAPMAVPVFDSVPAPPSATDSNVYRVSVRGGTSASLAVGYDFRGLAIDRTRAYWLDVYAGQVQSTPLDGGPVDVLSSGEVLVGAQGSLSAVRSGPALDDDAVYWLTQTGDLKRLAKPTP